MSHYLRGHCRGEITGEHRKDKMLIILMLLSLWLPSSLPPFHEAVVAIDRINKVVIPARENMPGGRQRSDSKRKLFRAITTRISHHNHVPLLDKDDCKDERDDREVAHSPYNDSTNINANHAPGVINNVSPAQMHGTDSQQTFTHTHDEFHNHNGKQQTGSIPISGSLPVPMTQGSDQTHYSYIESVKKAPVKKKSLPSRAEMITPTSSLKTKNSNNKLRSILSNTGSNATKNNNNNNGSGNNKNNNNNSSKRTPDSSKLDGCSPVTENSANTDISFLSKTDSMILNSDNKGDMNEYDYKTFSTRHPLRFSKVKAFEQAELTTKMYFSKYQEEDVGQHGSDQGKRLRMECQTSSNSNINNNNYNNNSESNNNSGNSDSNCEIIVQIPEMSRRETSAMLGHDTVETKIAENGSNRLKQQFGGGFMQNPVEQRLFLMKNALKPLSKEEIVCSKLNQSKLPDIFQNTGQFLKEMDPQEIEFWELMNEEFENDLQDLQVEYKGDQQRCRRLVDEATVQTFFERVKSNRRLGRRRHPGVERSLGALICQRVKDEFREEDHFTLNTN